jgi:Protein of unknown function (DUF3308).
MLKKVLLYVFCYASSFSMLHAQDARVAQYQSVPILMNPAQTGDFTGSLRISSLYAMVKSEAAKNQLLNISIDQKLGRKEQWALGLNYMTSGHSEFAMSGQYLGLSLAHVIRLDKRDIQTLRIGAMASLLSGKLDLHKGNYDHNLDVRAFRYWEPDDPSGNHNGSDNYFNVGIGAKYVFATGRIRFETGYSAYNVTNPDYTIMGEGEQSKRVRVTALTMFQYQLNSRNALRFEHLSWKEGLYMRVYDRASDDSTDIHETINNLSWLHSWKDQSISVGVYTRSWKAAGATLKYAFNQQFALAINHELPFLKKYYDVGHFELSAFVYLFNKKKATENRPSRQNEIEGLLPLPAK